MAQSIVIQFLPGNVMQKFLYVQADLFSAAPSGVQDKSATFRDIYFVYRFLGVGLQWSDPFQIYNGCCHLSYFSYRPAVALKVILLFLVVLCVPLSVLVRSVKS